MELFPLVESATQAVKDVLPLEEVVSSFVPAEITDQLPGSINVIDNVNQAMRDPLKALSSLNPFKNFDSEERVKVNLDDLDAPGEPVVKPSRRSLKRVKKTPAVKPKPAVPIELLPPENCPERPFAQLFKHREVYKQDPKRNAEKRIAKANRVLLLVHRKDIVEKAMSAASIFLDIKMSIFENQVDYISHRLEDVFHRKHLKAARDNLSKLQTLSNTLDQYQLLIQDGDEGEVKRQTLAILKKFSSSVASIHTEKKYNFGIVHDEKFEHLKVRVLTAVKCGGQTVAERKAFLRFLRDFISKWLTEEQLSRFNYIDGLFTPASFNLNQYGHKPNTRRFNPNKTSTVNLKKLSKEDSKLGSQAAEAYNKRVKTHRIYSAPRVKKGDAKSYDQGVWEWVMHKLAPPRVRDMVYNLSGPTKFLEWLEKNIYTVPDEEEIVYFHTAFMDRNYFDKRLNDFKASVPKPILVKWINQNIFKSETFVLHDGKEYRRVENPKLLETGLPSPGDILSNIYEKACAILRSFGGVTAAALDFFKSAYETIMGWLKKFVKIAAICADFLYQLLYNFIVLICNKFGVCLPAIDVTHGTAEHSPLLAEMSSDLVKEDPNPFADSASSSDQADFGSLSVTRFLKNLFGPFSSVLDSSLNEKSFISELKNATSVFSFLNCGMTFITKVIGLVVQFVQYLIKCVVGDPKADLLKKCDTLILAAENSTNVDLKFAQEFLHFYNALVNMNTKFNSKDILSGAYFRTRRAMYAFVPTMRSISNSSDKRNQPLSIHIVGAAGLGKTTLVPYITQILNGTTPAQNAADTYVWDPTGFQDGYNAQSIVVINDIFNEQDDQYDIRMCSDLLHIVSNDYWPVPVASPEKKGAVPLRAKIVVTTSNCVIFPAKAALRDANAYKRRRNVVVEMMRSSQSVMGEPAHAYDNYIFVLKNIYDEGNQDFWVPMDFKTFMRYLMIIKRDVVDKTFIQLVEQNPGIGPEDFESQIAAPSKFNDGKGISPQIASVWELTTKCHPTNTSNGTIRTADEAKRIADDLCNVDSKTGITTRNLTQSLAAADCLVGSVMKDAFIAENLFVSVDPIEDPYENMSAPLSLWHRFCDALVSNQFNLTKILTGVSIGLVGFATVLGIKSLVAPRFDKATDQNASGLTTVHASRNQLKVLKRPAAKVTTMAGDQGESQYVKKISDSICSATIALKGGLAAHFQVVFLDNKYLITNAHSLARVQSAKADGTLDTWYVTRSEGTVVPMDSLDFDKDMVKEEKTDLVFLRLPTSLTQHTNGQKSIVSHFVPDLNQVRPGFWSFETVRKRAASEPVPAVIHAVKRVRTINISLDDGRVYTDHLRGSVESAPGYCGSLLVGGPCRFVIGMHVSGDSANADFVPIDIETVLFFIRSTFDPNYSVKPVQFSESAPVPVDHPSVSEAVDQTEGDEVTMTEYEKITVFHLRGQPWHAPPLSWREASQQHPLLDCPNTLTPKVPSETLTKWLSKRYETTTPAQRILSSLTSSLTFWSVFLALVWVNSLTWIHALMVSLVKYLLLNSPPQVEVSFMEVFGISIPAPTTSTVILTIFCNLILSSFGFLRILTTVDLLDLMWPTVSKTNVSQLKRRESQRPNSSLLSPSPNLYICVGTLFLCYFTFAIYDLSLVWLLESTPTAMIFMSFMNISIHCLALLL